MTTKARKPKRTLTGPELCDELDISKANLSKYVRAGMPHDGDGRNRRYDAAECMKWMKDNNRGNGPGRPAEPVSDELQRLKCLKERALIRRYEREAAAAEGRLIDVADVLEKYKRLAVELRQRMHELPMRILSTPGLDMTLEQKHLADRHICELLDDVIRKVGDAMNENTTPFEAMTLDRKPLESELA